MIGPTIGRTGELLVGLRSKIQIQDQFLLRDAYA